MPPTPSSNLAVTPLAQGRNMYAPLDSKHEWKDIFIILCCFVFVDGMGPFSKIKGYSSKAAITSLEPGDKLQIGYKSIMRIDEWVSWLAS